jgi:hypothetical protein
MSMGLLVGFITAYPMNWWLVTYHLKHGMMTVRPAGAAAGARGHPVQAGMDDAPRAAPGTSGGGSDGAALVPGLGSGHGGGAPIAVAVSAATAQDGVALPC